MDRVGQCSQRAESRVVLVVKNLFNFCILCTKQKIYKPWTEVTLRIHTSSVTRLVLVIIFMPLWIKGIFHCKEQYSLAAERDGVVQPKPLKHKQIYLLSTVSSYLFIFICVHFL